MMLFGKILQYSAMNILNIWAKYTLYIIYDYDTTYELKSLTLVVTNFRI